MLFENIGDYAEIIVGIIFIAKMYCAFTETPTTEQSGMLYATTYKVIEKLALIFGKTKK